MIDNFGPSRVLVKALIGTPSSSGNANTAASLIAGYQYWTGQVFFDITSRVMSESVLRFSTTASCGSMVIPNWLSKNVTAFSTAIESRIPVVISAVVSVNAAGSSPGKNSLRMKFLTVAFMVSWSILEMRASVLQPKPDCHHLFIIVIASEQ